MLTGLTPGADAATQSLYDPVTQSACGGLSPENATPRKNTEAPNALHWGPRFTAERQGFEPWVVPKHYAELAIRCIRPLCHLSELICFDEARHV